MARVTFYEKPGCAGNARQKLWLRNAGHEVDARNMLTEPWTADRLRAFFGDRPVAQWFNATSPRVKSGEIVPANTDGATAILLMLEDRLLIRRPLMEADGRREVGFEPEIVDAWLGLTPETVERLTTTSAEACAQPAAGERRYVPRRDAAPD